MLARLESTLPRGPEWRYEPKLDGFRGLLWRSNTGAARVLNRNLKDLSVSFPELVRALEAPPLGTVIDGEIVIANADGSSDFGALPATAWRGSARCWQVRAAYAPRYCSPLTCCVVRVRI